MSKTIISAILASAALATALPAMAQPGFGYDPYGRGGNYGRGGYGQCGDSGYGGYNSRYNDGRGYGQYDDRRGVQQYGGRRGGRGGGFERYDQQFDQIERVLDQRMRNRSLNERQYDKVRGELNQACRAFERHLREGRLDERARRDLDGWVDRLQRLLQMGRYNDGRRY